MKYNKFIAPTIIILFVIIFNSCGTEADEKLPDEETPCPPIDIVSFPPYNAPIWHPSNKFIGFNYMPLDSIAYPYGKNCMGHQHFNYKETGFYLVNIDGSNQRKIFPYYLQTPQWSPDGKWIAFVMGAQIYKMAFDEITETFDTTQIIQLTTEGGNFFPSWSPNGKWIAYDSNKDSPNGGYRIWLMNSDGKNKELFAGGRMATWSKDSKMIYYIGFHNEIFKTDISDKSEIQLTKLNEKDIYATDNRCPQYSPLGNKLAFFSSGNGASGIWLLDIKSLALQKITKDNVYGDGSFSWSPNGKKIVYTKHDYDTFNYTNGCLWVVDVNTKKEYQLTFNKKGG